MNRTAEARVPQLPVLESRDIPNVVVPGEEISLSELIRHVKTEFGKADILIRGDITEDALNYIGRIQVSGERHNWRVETATASIAKEAAAIIPAIAKAAMHKSSPYVLLMYELNVERSHCSSTAPCNYKEPLALVNEMLAKPPSGVKVARLYIARSYIAEREGHLKDSLEDARTAAALDPRSAVALFNWGVVLSALHQPAKAIEKYERTLKIDPEFADAYDNWGNALVRQGLPEKALEKYAQAVQKNPKHTKAYTNWGLALFKLDRTKEAFEKYKQAVRIDPHYIDAYYYWGNTLLHSGQPEKAIEKYKQAIQINPKIAKLHFNLGNALLKLGRKKEAKKEFAVGERLKRGVGQQRSRSEDEP